MDKFKKYLYVFIISITISIAISIPFMFVSLHHVVYTDYPGCYQRNCPGIVDAPTGEETFGWPFAVCTQVVGGMPHPGDYPCNSINTYTYLSNFNAIADCLITFTLTLTITTIIVMLVDRKRTAKMKTKKHPQV